ncbi:MAG TPA: hypothetical protein VG052_01830 [Puia sp.]|nr:hypothetical protein [Puia sp.]
MKRKQNKVRRVASIGTAVTPEEYEQIRLLWKRSMCRSRSEYTRKVLLGQPVAMIARNVSLDSLIASVNDTRGVLETMLDCARLNEADREILIQLTKEIKQLFNQIVTVCIVNSEKTSA